MRVVAFIVLAFVCAAIEASAQQEMRVLATNKTSTMEKGRNETADAGYRFAAVR